MSILISRWCKRPLLFHNCVRSFAAIADDPAATFTAPKSPIYIKELHEPKYLELLKPAIPYYENVNIRVRGFDYPILESYIRFIQQICKDLKLKNSNFWGVPAVSMRQDSYKPASELVANSDVVKTHERTVQIKYMTSTHAAIFAEAILAAKPPGVVIRMAIHEVKDDDDRYIPDLQLQAMEKELVALKNETISVLTQTTTKSIRKKVGK